MNESSHFTQTGRAHRVIATIVIGTAAAAVTSGVALNEHPPAETVVERAAAGPSLADTVAPAARPMRRIQWRDPSMHPAPLRDPSVPAVATALEGVADPSSREPAPTF